MAANRDHKRGPKEREAGWGKFSAEMLSRPASIKEAKEGGLCRIYKSGNSQNTSICREGVCGDFLRTLSLCFLLILSHVVGHSEDVQKHVEHSYGSQ